MIENCTLYLPTRSIGLTAIVPDATNDQSRLGEPKQWGLPISDGLIILNEMPEQEMPGHLSQFINYASKFPASDTDLAMAARLINSTQVVLGVMLPAPIAETSQTYEMLKRIAFDQGGFVFVNNSMLTVDGYLVGPASTPTTSQVSPALAAMRDRNTELLVAKGFEPASSLPTPSQLQLRPVDEIAVRLAGLAMLFCYVALPEEALSEQNILGFLGSISDLAPLTPDELRIIDLPRAEATEAHQQNMGWRANNIWPLAWILGYDKMPAFATHRLQASEIQELLMFSPGPRSPISEYVASHQLRSLDTIIELEDRFYCAHNAVRSAQLGYETVPDGFDPVIDGGAVHERRHSLTWALSPGVDWDDTGLDT